MVRIVWTEVSLRDLREIFEYISEDSFRYANLTVNKIYRGAQVISLNPYSGKIDPLFKKTSARKLIIDNYSIIYRIKSDIQVDILRVFHSSRQLKRNIIR